MTGPSGRQILTAVAGAAWASSWYLMYLEVTRWQHVTPRLAFNPGPVPPGGVQPRPGRPLMLLYVLAAAAPSVTVAGVLTNRRGHHLSQDTHPPEHVWTRL